MSLYKSYFLKDESDGGGSDYGSSGTYSFRAFSLLLDNSVGRVSGLGSELFVPTVVESKRDIFSVYHVRTNRS